MTVGQIVCIGVRGYINKMPQPQMPKAISECKRFYLVKKGDDCKKIEKSYNLSHIVFRMLNPDIDDKCWYLLSGYYVCVGI